MMAALEEFMSGLVKRNPNEPEFHQAVHEVARDVLPYMEGRPEYHHAQIFERMTEPDRIIVFRVVWEDDQHNVRVNRGYRVQFNQAIGPYKGGLRFDPSVNMSVLKFLGFEQTFKNSLTGLPMGSGKGGSNFNPKGKSEAEIMRFCQSYMTELCRHIGQYTDVPAGDIGVGGREIGYLFGQHKRITNEFTGVLTGKGLDFGGSEIRIEATGYGCVYFANHMLVHVGGSLEGKACLVSGSGNVAQYAARKLIELGAKVLTLSDRSGFIHDPEGLTSDKLDEIVDYKIRQRKSLADYAQASGCSFIAEQKPWAIVADAAFPCATQNEIQLDDAKTLLANGCRVICEGANMPTTAEAAELLEQSDILYGPAKAANAGGVAVSGLEMSQNSMRYNLSRQEINDQLSGIMMGIHERCVEYGAGSNGVDYVKGANLAGFVKVAGAMLAYGAI
ncbi:MAG: NADP-specific glutamate dehydrogenase [Pseudomonadales bacterium]